MIRRTLLVVLLLPLLTACSAYHPLSGGVGFADVPMGQDTFRVSYTGEGAMPVAQARQYCLTRAAELAVMANRPAFEILNEHILLGYGSSYMPPTYYPSYGGYYGRGRRWGGRSGYYSGFYDPGYVETYMIPEVTLQVRLVNSDAAQAIPAAYLLREAKQQGIKLSPGVEERVASLPPVMGNVELPPAPQPTTKPAPQ